jgi:hypothetical protein
VRFTAKPVEMSLVDAPCLEDAKYQIVKADGGTELRKFDGEHTGQDRAELDLDKADGVPAAEEPTGQLSLVTEDKEYYTPAKEPTIAVERMPDPFRTTALQPGSQPTAETLTAYTNTSKELTEAVNKLINQFPKTLHKAVNEAVEKAIAGVFGTTSEVSLHRMIPVKPGRMIKVHK